MDGAFGNMTVDKMMKVAQSIGDLAENRHFYAYTFHDDEAKYFQGAGLAKNAPESETNPKRAFTSASRILRRWVGISTVPAK